MSTIANSQLKAFIERIERCEEDKAAVAADIREIYAELKANGYDVKTVRAIIRLRSLDAARRQEAEALLETYKAALGLA